MNKMYNMQLKKIGITGGIGSGKTTVCRFFEAVGIPVYQTDVEMKRLINTDTQLMNAVKKIFGETAYNSEGYNRDIVGKIAFEEPEKLKALETVAHPVIKKDLSEWFAHQKNVPYAICESALIYEGDFFTHFDKIIAVTAPLEERIERIMFREWGRLTQLDVQKRIDKQTSQEEIIRRADFVIDNDGEKPLAPQVFKIHRKLVQL